jgi:hypothetical protein
MTDFTYLAGSLALIAALAIAVERFLTFHSQHLVGDEERLRVAADRLKAHQDAVEIIMSHPKAGADLKRVICTFSDAVMNHIVARSMVHSLLKNESFSGSLDDEDRAIFETLQKYEQYEDLKGFVSTAIRNGLVGMVLQWTDTSKQMAAALSEIATEAEPEVVGKAMTIHRVRSSSNDDRMRFVPA